MKIANVIIKPSDWICSSSII